MIARCGGSREIHVATNYGHGMRIKDMEEGRTEDLEIYLRDHYAGGVVRSKLLRAPGQASTRMIRLADFSASCARILPPIMINCSI